MGDSALFLQVTNINAIDYEKNREYWNQIKNKYYSKIDGLDKKKK